MPITFSEIEKVTNGAQFLNADLHVHSFGGSHDVKDTTMTVETIVDTAVAAGVRGGSSFKASHDRRPD
jgi:hypothetical protein